MFVDFNKAVDYLSGLGRQKQDGEQDVLDACRVYLIASFKHGEAELYKATEPRTTGFKEK